MTPLAGDAAPAAQRVTFGLHPAADVRASDLRARRRAAAAFGSAAGSGRRRWRFPLLGDFNVANALAAAACALGLGRSLARGRRRGSPPRPRCRAGWSGSATRPASCSATTPTRPDALERALAHVAAAHQRAG